MGSRISFQGRITLAKSALNSIPIHNMAVYKWPSSLIKEGDNILRNYIWTEDPTKRKGVMLKWDKEPWKLESGNMKGSSKEFPHGRTAHNMSSSSPRKKSDLSFASNVMIGLLS
ncbi:hypothetical protein GIB67_040769 [Kingdonia uniflora]|uniref:Uncharacterized protein n=1 Tax=Kingdonia uniflora TaxID=39325 RepID=A0A7J7LUS9_9MAGN|nr:hypothetical protein GIB67_040769 [Kingdonia uniflora]